MPSIEEHMANDLNRWGLEMSYPHIHELLDQFAHYPDMRFLIEHRKFLHHKEGIAYITMRFGALAGIAATGHVLDDCGHIPSALDYYIGKVDNFGREL